MCFYIKTIMEVEKSPYNVLVFVFYSMLLRTLVCVRRLLYYITYTSSWVSSLFQDNNESREEPLQRAGVRGRGGGGSRAGRSGAHGVPEGDRGGRQSASCLAGSV